MADLRDLRKVYRDRLSKARGFFAECRPGRRRYWVGYIRALQTAIADLEEMRGE